MNVHPNLLCVSAFFSECVYLHLILFMNIVLGRVLFAKSCTLYYADLVYNILKSSRIIHLGRWGTKFSSPTYCTRWTSWSFEVILQYSCGNKCKCTMKKSPQLLSQSPVNQEPVKVTVCIPANLTPKDPGVFLVKTTSNQPLLKRRRSVRNWIIF
jgi:hypothetical protein